MIHNKARTTGFAGGAKAIADITAAQIAADYYTIFPTGFNIADILSASVNAAINYAHFFSTGVDSAAGYITGLKAGTTDAAFVAGITVANYYRAAAQIAATT